MIKCYYCDVEINGNNRSKEHIIHDFLGGNITSTDLLCVTCNSKLGETIDSEFHAQLKPFVNLIVAKNKKKKFRERLIDIDGKEYFVKQNMVPLSRIYIKDVNGNAEKILHLQDEDELAKQMKKKGLETLGKYKVSEIYLEQPPKETLYFTNSLSNQNGQVGFGGPYYHKAILKIAINYYLSFGYDRQYIEDAIKVLKGESADTRLSIFYYPRQYKIHELKEGEVSNLLFLVGDPEQRMLYCYIELLSSECLIVKLNTEYGGPALKKQNAFDVVTQINLEKQIKIQLLRHHLEFLHLATNTDLHENLHNRLIKIIESKQYE
jgi:hypothetical protein